MNIIYKNKRNYFFSSLSSSFSSLSSSSSLFLKDKVEVNIILDKKFQKVISNKQIKTKLLLHLKEKPTLKYLNQRIIQAFPNLNKVNYGIQFIIPTKTDIIRPFQNDSDLIEALKLSTEPNSPHLKIYIEAINKHLPNPLESESYAMISFYLFKNISNPENLIITLKELWKPYHVYGRVYVANEGINAQMSVPSNVLDQFKNICSQFPLLSNVTINVDKHISAEEYFNTKPFRALHIRYRKQIVTDGFDHSLNWDDAGTELSSIEWNKQLLGENSINNEKPLLFDCRNAYESDIGIFEGAVPLNTVRFSDSWDILEKVLEGKPKDTPIMTYCTGGIRCVKINAFLKQTLGFTNTSRLKGGIISYAREIRQHEGIITTPNNNQNSIALTEKKDVLPSQLSLFKGVNYVFDDRMGSRITDDVLTGCEICGTPWDSFTNCKNGFCSVRFLQCPKCSAKYSGCCSLSCRNKYFETAKANISYVSQHKKNIDSSKNSTQKSYSIRQFSTLPSQDIVESYCERMSQSEPSYLKELRNETEKVFPEVAHMLSGPLQGRFLSQISSLVKPRRILELGTFTGYSALCLAEGLPPTAPFSSLVTIEKDQKAINIAERYFNQSPYKQIDLRCGKISDVLQSLSQTIGNDTFDLVFIDADKKQLWGYLMTIIGDKNQPSLLSNGALVITDNTLWKGRVLESSLSSNQNDNICSDNINSNFKIKNSKVDDKEDSRTKVIHEYNMKCASHPHLQTVMLPLRDGLTLSRYHK